MQETCLKWVIFTAKKDEMLQGVGETIIIMSLSSCNTRNNRQQNIS